MSPATVTNSRTRFAPEAAESSRFSRFSLSAGESGRIRENRNVILPGATAWNGSNLQQERENKEDISLLCACAGARARARTVSVDEDHPNPPHSPVHALLAIFINNGVLIWD